MTFSHFGSVYVNLLPEANSILLAASSTRIPSHATTLSASYLYLQSLESTFLFYFNLRAVAIKWNTCCCIPALKQTHTIHTHTNAYTVQLRQYKCWYVSHFGKARKTLSVALLTASFHFPCHIRLPSWDVGADIFSQYLLTWQPKNITRARRW